MHINASDDVYGNAVMHKISTDIDFLRYSPLRKNIEFSNSNDPLFLYPLRKFWSLKMNSNYNSRAVLNLFEISSQMRERLNKAENVIKGGTPYNKE